MKNKFTPRLSTFLKEYDNLNIGVSNVVGRIDVNHIQHFLELRLMPPSVTVCVKTGDVLDMNDEMKMLSSLIKNENYLYDIKKRIITVKDSNNKTETEEHFSDLVSSLYCIKNEEKWLSNDCSEEDIDYIGDLLDILINMPIMVVQSD